MRRHGGISGLGDAPGAPLCAALTAGTHSKQVIGVCVQVEHQELAVTADVGILVLARRTLSVLQTVVLRCKVVVNL